eukprot:g3495.t1
MALSKGGASKHKLGKYEVTRGASKHQLGKYEEAIADFDMAIKLDPKFAVALYKRGASKHMLGKYEEAIADFDMDINLNPKYALALDKRGASKHMLGKYEEAIADFDMAIQLNQTVQLFQSHGNIAKLAAQAYFHLGYSKQILGRYWHAEAMKDYGRASELDPKHGEYRDRTVEAHELRVGSEVILDCSRATGTITSVKWRHEPTIVLKIGFKPDFPAWLSDGNVPPVMAPKEHLSEELRAKLEDCGPFGRPSGNALLGDL